MTLEATFAPPAEAEGLSLRLLPHALRPVPYLAQEMFEGFMRAFGARAIYINGFAYVAPGGGGEPPNPLEASPFTDPLEAWEKHARKHSREICEGLWSQDYAAWPIQDLMTALPGYFAEAGRAFAYTMQPLMSAVAPTGQLLAFCGEKFGPDGARIGMTLLQGFENDSAARGLALEDLATLAQVSPGLLASVTAGNRTGARAAAGGEAFDTALDAYLDIYGHGSVTWWELHEPTWGEDPSLALRLLASYAADPQRGPAAAHKRAVAEREAAIAKCESDLTDADREQFHSLLAAAGDYVSVVEGRAHWQQNCVGALRPICLALATKLVERGSLAATKDIFHLTLEELAALTADASPTPPAAIVERSAELTSWGSLDAPLFLGPPPEAPAGGPNPMALMFGGPAERTGDPTLLKGVGASVGTVEARARVIVSLDDAEQLQPGEVLVCPFTAPSWMPLFATAGAIVTNQGGVLSHAAIEAREYGLPCVVGTEFGTQRIPDGALVTIDGLAGTVRIHPD